MGTPPAGGMPSGFTPGSGKAPAGFTPPSGTTPAATSSTTDNNTASAQAVTLKDGLSATVDIISQEANNVLIVPDKAVKQSGQNYSVQVVKGTTTETRAVKIGISDGTNTEITSGLNEGEEVTYTLSVSGSSSTSSSSKSSSQAVMPGLGGGGPPGGGF